MIFLGSCASNRTVNTVEIGLVSNKLTVVYKKGNHFYTLIEEKEVFPKKTKKVKNDGLYVVKKGKIIGCVKKNVSLLYADKEYLYKVEEKEGGGLLVSRLKKNALPWELMNKLPGRVINRILDIQKEKITFWVIEKKEGL